MNRLSMRVGAIPLIAVTLLTATTGPAAATEFHGTGLYARFGPSVATDVRGLVVVDRANSDSPPVNVDLLGLMPLEQVTINFRSVGCGEQPARSNRVARLSAAADDQGNLFVRKMSSSHDWASVRSIWINQGELVACRPAMHFRAINRMVVGDWNGDGALALVETGEGQILGNLLFLLEERPNDRARLSIVVNGLGGDDTLRLRLVDEVCGVSPAKTLVNWEVKDLPTAAFRSVVVNMSAAQIDRAFSLRVKSLAGDNTWCGDVSLINNS